MNVDSKKVVKGWQNVHNRHWSWLATMKNKLSYHNLSVEDATELSGNSGGYWQLCDRVDQSDACSQAVELSLE